MKKIIFLSIFIISICKTGFSQQFGIEAGPIYSTFDLKANIPLSGGLGLSLDNINKIGFFAGPTANFGLTDLLDFQSALYLSYKGGAENRNILGAKVEARIDAFYLELPLQVIFKFPLAENFFAIGTGPSLNFMIKEDLNFAVSNVDSGNILNDIANINALETFEASWKISAGYSSNHFDFRGIANLGMTNILDSNIFKAKNNYYGLGLTYKF